MWIIFVIPTIILAIDFIWVSSHYKGVLVEHMHYWAYFFWILVCDTSPLPVPWGESDFRAVMKCGYRGS
jgi:hypothetical protein